MLMQSREGAKNDNLNNKKPGVFAALREAKFLSPFDQF
jgi:hypothetical protein